METVGQHSTGPHAVPQNFQSPPSPGTGPDGEAHPLGLAVQLRQATTDDAGTRQPRLPTSFNHAVGGETTRPRLASASLPDVSGDVDAFMRGHNTTYQVFKNPPESDILRLRMAAIARFSTDPDQAREWFTRSCELDLPASWDEEAKAHALATIWFMETNRELAREYFKEIDLCEDLKHDAEEAYAALLLLSELQIDLFREPPLHLPEPAPHYGEGLFIRYQMIEGLKRRISESDKSEHEQIIGEFLRRRKLLDLEIWQRKWRRELAKHFPV